MAFQIDAKGLEQAIGAAIMEAVTNAAEPIIEEAVERLRTETRKKIAAVAAGVIESGYSFERTGSIVKITVDLEGGRRGG